MEYCGKPKDACTTEHFSLDNLKVDGECCDWVFVLRWSPKEFVNQAVRVGHPFATFSGLPSEVKSACDYVAECNHADLVNFRCSKLGEWLRWSKQLQKDETALKESMPEERRKILQSKRLCLMRKIISEEGHEDKDLALQQIWKMDSLWWGKSLDRMCFQESCCLPP